MTHMPPTTRSLQTGFSLIEALVALLVLSVGLLGLAGLQLLGMQSSHSAYQRTVASVIATDAGERLWLGMAKAWADNGEFTGADVEAIRDEWRDHWQQGGTDLDGNHRVTLPGISASDIGSCDQDVCEITVHWTEGRFDETDDTTEFHYRVWLPVEVTGGSS
ncbi:type IV pilus modification protein PilV [Ectothiorhodospira variabilis]|uniref:type IV pilus modification protein PilV n=1 Tax=Ectothiorhodospira variabilis TaxID=505694 RepID=UPI001EFB2BDC|nr:type IV pilus modification protein PilV [Ectothiorhodospira variabilis]MCG5496904.1 type IV pilus modification protein PilV [Ectothiorhodospira variabilis]